MLAFQFSVQGGGGDVRLLLLALKLKCPHVACV
jgi:hypothetical protein